LGVRFMTMLPGMEVSPERVEKLKFLEVT
jgi:hypothetical protein